MAPFLRHFRRVWFKTGKEDSGMVRLGHGRLPRDDLRSRSRAGTGAYGGIFRHAGRRHDIREEVEGVDG